MFNRFLTSNNHLEDTQNASSQRIFVIVFRVNFLKGFESFNCVVKVTHLVGIVANQLQKVVRICWGLGWDIDVPSIFRFAVHDVGSYQPFDVSLLAFVFLVSDCQEAVLRFFVVSSGCVGQSVIPMEIIVRLEIALDAVKINHDIIKLLQEEEATRHALSSGNSVALSRRGADKLEELLCSFEMFFWIFFLPVHQIWNRLDNILSGVSGLEIFN